MFTNIQNLGAAAVLAVSASTALAVQQQNVSNLDQSAHVEQMRGPLRDVLPPRYDGPVMWQNISVPATASERGLLGSVLGGAGGLALGAIGAAIAIISKDDEKSARRGLTIFGSGTLVGALAGAAIGYLTPSDPISVVSFATQIREVVKAESSHAETRTIHVGKTTQTITESPFYSEVVSIPETDLLLGSNSYRAPLIPGEKINAWFFMDQEGHIISWVAEPAAR